MDKKFLKKMLTATILVGGINFLPVNFEAGNFQVVSVAHAEIKTYIGVGDYVLSEDTPPSDIKDKAKMYAERNALEQAGVFVSGLTEVKDHAVSKDEIVTIVGGILKITDTKFEIVPLNDAAGIAKYRATVTAEVDTNLLEDAIQKWLNRDESEKENLVQQNKSQQKTIEDLQKKIAELEKQATEVKTAQDKQNLQEKISEIDNETLAAQKVEEGNIFTGQGNFQGAIPKYTEAINLNPNLYQAHYNRGTAYLYLQNFSQAVEDFNQAIKINPNFTYAYCNRGLCYVYLQNFTAAIEDFTNAINLDSNLYQAYYSRGMAYYYSQNPSQAISDFTQAINLNPNIPTGYVGRGVCYQTLGNYAKAQEDYAKARELGYQF